MRVSCRWVLYLEGPAPVGHLEGPAPVGYIEGIAGLRESCRWDL